MNIFLKIRYTIEAIFIIILLFIGYLFGIEPENEYGYYEDECYNHV